MMKTRTNSHRFGHHEEGIALIVVMLLGLIAFALATALVSYGSTSTPLSRKSQDWNGAMSAAEAGLDDYIHRLSVDGNYWTYGSTPPDPNAALTGFKDIPGTNKAGEFTYEVTGTPTPERPTVRVKVTGKSRDSNRTIEATLRRTSFLDFIYATDFETKDPQAYEPAADGAGRDTTYANLNCANRYRYPITGATPVPARPNNGCSEIRFAPFDVIRGPLHSNDSLLIAGGATFEDVVQTNWAAGPDNQRWVPVGAGLPVFQRGLPVLKDPLPIPPSNRDLVKFADGTVGGAGCLYTGPTRINLRADGKMDVHSPRTRSTNPGCGPGLGLNLPVNNVVYVQNVPPNSSTADPNRNESAASPCTYRSPLTTPPNQLIVCPQPNGAGVRYPTGFPVPLANDRTNTSPVDQYVHKNGDVFLSGTLDGKLTIGSANDIIITDDVVYENAASGSDDILGLVPYNSVKVFHPVRADTGGELIAGLWGGRARIHAAMLTVARSFMVQNPRHGDSLGTLEVYGAIAQKYRGIVGTSTAAGVPVTGFGKDYRYDSRLKVQSPPHFLDPVRTAWEIKTWSEVDVNR